jgi:hypothetical protein
MSITRFHHPSANEGNGKSFAITSSAATTEAIFFGDFASGRIYVPSGSSLTSLTFYDAPSMSGTFLASYDDAASPAAISLSVSAGNSYPIPAKLYGSGAIKMVGNTAGTVYLSRKG